MTTSFGTKHQPTEIRLKKDEKILEVEFDDGKTFAFPAELLRVESPSAEVQGHGPDQKKIISGRKHVGIMKVEPVGNYAISITFDDLHGSGIWAWDTLYELGETQDTVWAEYLANMENLGLSREPH